MRVLNKTNGKVITQEAKVCKGILNQAIGLRFSSKPKFLIFDLKKLRRSTFDMFFVFFSIDVLFLDEEKKVVDIKERFKPFRAYTPKESFRFAIELPAGIVKKANISMGDLLEF